MKVITAKRDKLNFHFMLALSALFSIGSGTLMILTYFGFLSTEFNNKDYIITAALFLLGLYLVVTLVKSVPSIKLDNERILFGQTEYYLKDIEEIQLTGKKPLRYYLPLAAEFEGAMLKFKNGDVRFFYDDMYINEWEIKSFLEQVIVNKKDYVEMEPEKIDSSFLRSESIEMFKGNQFVSTRGFTLWLFFAIFLYLSVAALFGELSPGAILFLAFTFFWFFFHSRFMHYFGLTKDFLVVKNHARIWKRHIYRISEIKEVVFETEPRMPYCLRVIMKDYRNQLYAAGTLRDKHWLRLKDELEKRNVIVRNECI